MKIGIVLPAIPAYSETFFRNKILGLQKNGHQVVLFVNNSEDVTSYLNSKVVKAPKLSGNKIKVLIITLKQLMLSGLNFRKNFKLFKLNQEDNISFKQNMKQIVANQFLLNEQLDWLHFGFGTMALGRENIANVIGAKMAVSFRGYDYYVFPFKNKNCYTILFKKEVKYHVLSEAMKKGLIERGISKNRIVKITPAINLDLFSTTTEETKDKNLKLVTISRLHYIKGLEYILQALSMLKKEGFNFHFTIIGDGVEKERLQFATYQLNLVENVTFKGKLSPQEVKEELNKTDIYLQYSIQEGFCNAVLEAQAMGLLCVVSDAEGLSENVLDGKTGFVVVKQNPHLLYKKIKEVIALPEIKKQKIKQSAVERVQQEFNLEKQQQEFLQFYQNL